MVDLRVRSNSSSVTVSWTPPFSLDVTDVDPDVWYSLLIYNMTDENSTTDNLCTTVWISMRQTTPSHTSTLATLMFTTFLLFHSMELVREIAVLSLLEVYKK